MKFAKWVIAFSLIITIGGPWAVLQSVAWLGMAITYSEDATLSEALVKTFDGRHPCQLCKIVTAGKQSEQKRASIQNDTKFDFWLGLENASVFAPTPFVVPLIPIDSAPLRAESPPTPPPRLA